MARFITFMMGTMLAFAAYGQARYIPSFLYWPGICPPHAPQRDCSPNPCHVHTCPMRKDAICELNHCGGCQPDYFDERGRKIPLEECFDLACKPDLPIVHCKTIKKGSVKCAAHPDAIFIASGGCHFCGTFFKFGRRLLEHECLENPFDIATCEGEKSRCKEDPCAAATCNTTSRTLICVPDYCKCTHHFVNEYNQSIKCGEPIYKPKKDDCPSSSDRNKPVRCLHDTCSKKCRKDHEAVCIHECGSCKPSYFDRRGNRINMRDCL